MPEDPVIRWENEGGAVLRPNDAARDALWDESEAEPAHVKDRHGATPVGAHTKPAESTTSVE